MINYSYIKSKLEAEINREVKSMGGLRINQCHAASCATRDEKRKKRKQFMRDIPWIIGAFILFFVAGSADGLIEHLIK